MVGRGALRFWQWACLLLIGIASYAAGQGTVDTESLQRARNLAWSKHFAEAEAIYRALLQKSPRSYDGRIGLAHVLLWEGRYRDARKLFLQLASERPADADALEGAATAAYWQGDFRTAAREYEAIVREHSGRKNAMQNLRDIQLATRNSERLVIDGVDDDQPYRLWRSEAVASFFSDPLTRWDVTAGAYRADNPAFSTTRTEPFATVSNEFVFPWQRLTLTTTLGALRWPDGRTGPIGGLALRWRTTRASSIEAAVERRELLRTSTSIRAHPSLRRERLGWTRYADREWFAGIEAGRLRDFDRNEGWYAQGYGLWPVVRRNALTVWGGFSAALRDTRDSRFYVEAISSSREGPEFLYSYRGAYTPYWTPQRLSESRAIVSAMRTAGRATIKAQAEVGVARDRAESFGPAAGPSPLPATIFTIDFHRTFHPTRFSIGSSLELSPAFDLELSAERDTTVFYRSNEFKATLVRHH